MKNAEIEKTWKEHFPRRQQDRTADQVCRQTCRLILERAKHEIKPPGRYNAERLNRILRESGIKKIQFAQVVAEDSQLNDLFQHFQAKPERKRRTP